MKNPFNKKQEQDIKTSDKEHPETPVEDVVPKGQVKAQNGEPDYKAMYEQLLSQVQPKKPQEAPYITFLKQMYNLRNDLEITQAILMELSVIKESLHLPPFDK